MSKELRHPPYYAIKAWEILAKISGEEVASRLGMSYRTYFNKVNGYGDFSVAEANRLCEILGRTMDEIFLV